MNRFMRRRLSNGARWIGLALAIVLNSALAQAPAEERPADHAALREILAKGTEALNTGNFDAIASVLHPAFTIITVDNQKLVGLEPFREYWKGLFEGDKALLQKIEVHPEADELTRFVADNVGIVYGTSNDTYTFRDGAKRTMRTRWSAVLEKDGEAWKLVNVHFSASILDNPVVDIAKNRAMKLAAGTAVAGLLLGLLIMGFLRRKPGTASS
jgi:ketosteroid isomerase-like protein